MHSISDLTTFCRKTSGEVPAKLVGASTTVVGSKVYLFGGRLVTERRMVSDLYEFCLETFVWTKLPEHPEDDVPRARYFHSADTWNNQLIIFGGMGNQPNSTDPEKLCVLNDVRFFDLGTRRWSSASSSNVPADSVSDSLTPDARYAHLSSVTADRLFIIGGQDLANSWMDDIYVYDLLAKAWVQRRDYPRHCGTYRSVAVSADSCVRLPQEERQGLPSNLGPAGTRFQTDMRTQPSGSADITSPESLVHLPYSTAPSEEYPSDIYLYSNYNFTDVKRELEVFSPLPDTDFTITDRSTSMVGASFPPGLRFPTGAILGNHFIIAGTYLAHTYQSFSIWALDLTTMQWSRIDPGSAVSTGSWFRGCLWAEANKFLIFGNRNGNLVDDYNRRLLSWDHVAVIDLEAFGIYRPPPLVLDIRMQELGLSALEENILSDFEIICDDGRSISCSRKILEERWPWFKDQRRKFQRAAQNAGQNLPPTPMHVSLPQLPGQVIGQEPRSDPRLTPRSFHLSEPYPITLALLQYIYSMALLTPLQQAPAVLSQLLVISSTYEMTHLESLVQHAMHRALSNATSVGVYEVATLCSCRSLQIRALKTVMSYSQKRPANRSRQDSRDGPGGGGGGGGGGFDPNSNGNGGSNNGPGGPNDSSGLARPRGMSDAPFRGMSDPQNGPPGGAGGRQYQYAALNDQGYPTDSLAELIQATIAPTPLSPSAPPINRSTRPKRPSLVSSEPRPLATLEEDEVSAPSSMPFGRPSVSPRPPRARPSSAVSQHTDDEISALAELMSPSLIQTVRYGADRGLNSLFAEEEDDMFITPEFRQGGLQPPSATRRAQSSFSSISSGYLGHSYTPSPSSAGGSNYYQSDFDHSDDGLSPLSAFHSQALPRPGMRYRSDSDTPSLTSSTSYGSLRSASRRLNSLPTTPAVSTHDFDFADRAPSNYLDEHPHYGGIDDRPAFSQRQADEDFYQGGGPKSAQPVVYPQPKYQTQPLEVQTTTAPFLRSELVMSPQSSEAGSSTKSKFSRFLGRGKNPSKEQLSDTYPLSRSQSTISGSGEGSLLDTKHPKEAEKKRKKAEAKARTERLAIDLRVKQDKRKAAAESGSMNSEDRRKERSHVAWEEQGGMYGTGSAFVM